MTAGEFHNRSQNREIHRATRAQGLHPLPVRVTILMTLMLAMFLSVVQTPELVGPTEAISMFSDDGEVRVSSMNAGPPGSCEIVYTVDAVSFQTRYGGYTDSGSHCSAKWDLPAGNYYFAARRASGSDASAWQSGWVNQPIAPVSFRTVDLEQYGNPYAEVTIMVKNLAHIPVRASFTVGFSDLGSFTIPPEEDYGRYWGYGGYDLTKYLYEQGDPLMQITRNDGQTVLVDYFPVDRTGKTGKLTANSKDEHGSWFFTTTPSGLEPGSLSNLVFEVGGSVPAPNTLPTLSGAGVTPATGTNLDEYRFYVTYSDGDDERPTTNEVYIDGTPHSMTKVDPDDSTYTNGVQYEFTTRLAPGSHQHYFYFEDGRDLVSSDIAVGPTVTEAPTPDASVTFTGGGKSQSKDGFPLFPANYSVELENVGDADGTFSFEVSADRGWNTTVYDAFDMPITSIDLDVGEKRTVTVQVGIPNGTDPGMKETTEFTMVPDVMPEDSDKVAMVTTMGEPIGVNLEASAPQRSGPPGANVTHTFTATNLGIEADVLDVQLLPSEWPVIITDDSGTVLVDNDADGTIDTGSIPSMGQRTLKAIVSLPGSDSGATGGDIDSFSVMVASSMDDTYTDTVTVDTVYGKVGSVTVNNTDNRPEKLVMPGEQARFQFEVINRGNADDVIDFVMASTGLSTRILGPDFQPLNDTDGDGSVDTGPIPRDGASIFYVESILTDQALEGESYDIEVLGYSSNQQGAMDSVSYAVLPSLSSFEILSNQTLIVEKAESPVPAFFKINVTNTGLTPGIVDVVLNSTHDWGVTLVDLANHELVDSDGNGIPDLGNVPQGTRREFMVRVDIPSDTLGNVQNIISVQSSFRGQYHTVTDTLELVAMAEPDADLIVTNPIIERRTGGGIRSYEFTVENRGNVPDALVIDYADTLEANGYPTISIMERLDPEDVHKGNPDRVPLSFGYSEISGLDTDTLVTSSIPPGDTRVVSILVGDDGGIDGDILVYSRARNEVKEFNTVTREHEMVVRSFDLYLVRNGTDLPVVTSFSGSPGDSFDMVFPVTAMADGAVQLTVEANGAMGLIPISMELLESDTGRVLTDSDEDGNLDTGYLFDGEYDEYGLHLTMPSSTNEIDAMVTVTVLHNGSSEVHNYTLDLGGTTDLRVLDITTIPGEITEDEEFLLRARVESRTVNTRFRMEVFLDGEEIFDELMQVGAEGTDLIEVPLTLPDDAEHSISVTVTPLYRQENTTVDNTLNVTIQASSSGGGEIDSGLAATLSPGTPAGMTLISGVMIGGGALSGILWRKRKLQGLV